MASDMLKLLRLNLSTPLQLFDFDIEVKPILEVLVGKTVEQALLEVMEEEELANLRAQQRRFEEMRHAELVETQRLEEQERRHREEKQRRMRQQLEVLKKEKETNDKIAARAFAQVNYELFSHHLFIFCTILLFILIRYTFTYHLSCCKCEYVPSCCQTVMATGTNFSLVCIAHFQLL